MVFWLLIHQNCLSMLKRNKLRVILKRIKFKFLTLLHCSALKSRKKNGTFFRCAPQAWLLNTDYYIYSQFLVWSCVVFIWPNPQLRLRAHFYASVVGFFCGNLMHASATWIVSMWNPIDNTACKSLTCKCIVFDAVMSANRTINVGDEYEKKKILFSFPMEFLL